MKALDLMSGAQGVAFFTDGLCEQLTSILSEDAGTAVSHTRSEGPTNQQAAFSAEHKDTQLVMTVDRTAVVVTQVKLQNKGQGFYSKLLSLLVKEANSAGLDVIIQHVTNPGLATWCERNGFVPSGAGSDYIHTVVRKGV